MQDKIGFSFEAQDLAQLEQRGTVYVVDGTKISNQLELFDAYGKGLKAPSGYFGTNWNAFLDCLAGLDWIEAFDVFIVHSKLPQLSDGDMAIYIDILHDAVETWADKKTDDLHRLFPDEFIPHHLTVFFPRDVEGMVASYLERPGQPTSEGT